MSAALTGHAMAGNPACPGLERPTLYENLKIQPNDVGSQDFFGWAVAIDGGRAVVGAHQHGPFVSGKAYLIDAETGSVIARLAPSDGGNGDNFGYSVAIDGDTVIVGSIYNANGGLPSGAAYLYNIAGASGVITETAKLVASNRQGFDLIGVSVAVSGDRAVVGAEGVESAYVFDIAGASGLLTESATLVPSDSTFRFGAAVAIDGNTAIVGSPHGGAGSNPNGKAYMFDLAGASGFVTETARLVPTNGAIGDQFGASVAIDGDSVVVGALRNEGNNGVRAGTVYLFDVANAVGQVHESAMLLTSDRIQSDNFGRSVSVRGSTVFVGASSAFRDQITFGTAYQFSIAGAGNGAVICEQAMLRSSVPGPEESFGTSVAYDGRHALVGTPGSIRLDNLGAVYRYRINADLPGAGIVVNESKISALSGGFQGPLGFQDAFGSAVVSIGDLDGDGIDDLAVGANTTGGDLGAVWVLFMNADGTVRDQQKIAQGVGGFNGPLTGQARFGKSIAAIGDLDGDGVPDLVVGASNDSGSGTWRGAVWVLFMNPDGTVKAEQKISETHGGFGGTLNNSAQFGSSVAAIGDLDGDGVPDLAVGTPGDTDGGTSRGAVWVLFMNPDGTVKGQQKISSTSGGFAGAPNDFSWFGASVDVLGDLDGDGVADLVVGAHGVQESGLNTGAVWVLFMNPDGTVKAEQKISNSSGGFSGPLMNNDRFGFSIASLGDIDMDGVPDIAVGAWLDSQEGPSRGSVWIICLNTDGTVKYEQKISGTQGGFAGPLDDLDAFGSSVAVVNNIHGDGKPALAVGAIGDDDGFQNAGAVWLLSLNGVISDGIFECPADINGDGALNFFDIAEFLNLYQAQDPIADWNDDGLFNFFDMAAYLNDFNAGCP
ncbi:MAG: FG-GAP-like repeat-containing protein [Phycisphaerales bacterium]|nr:FG-GAP repeat protein [Planctomycetota bacterium]MCH8507402.1 FG-GAP-like repeat-containing protein [Phycisphaerales bacterium]